MVYAFRLQENQAPASHRSGSSPIWFVVLASIFVIGIVANIMSQGAVWLFVVGLFYKGVEAFFLLALVVFLSVLSGLFLRKKPRAFFIVVDEKGITEQRRYSNEFNPWSDIAAVAFRPGVLTVSKRDGEFIQYPVVDAEVNVAGFTELCRARIDAAL